MLNHFFVHLPTLIYLKQLLSMINLFFNLGNFSSQSLSSISLNARTPKNETVFITCEPLSPISQIDLINSACRYLERYFNTKIYCNHVVTNFKLESCNGKSNCIRHLQFQIHWD